MEPESDSTRLIDQFFIVSVKKTSNEYSGYIRFCYPQELNKASERVPLFCFPEGMENLITIPPKDQS